MCSFNQYISHGKKLLHLISNENLSSRPVRLIRYLFISLGNVCHLLISILSHNCHPNLSCIPYMIYLTAKVISAEQIVNVSYICNSLFVHIGIYFTWMESIKVFESFFGKWSPESNYRIYRMNISASNSD